MKYNRKLIIILVVVSCLRLLYIVYTPFDLSPDEAHYWEWSRHLALSYYSKGPGVAYIIAFFTAILGNTELGVRAGAVAFAGGGTYFIYLIGRVLSGQEKTGFYAALLSLITPLLSVGSVLMTTDAPFVFFWAGAVFFFMRAFRTGSLGHWATAGLLAGLGFLSKYTMVLIYPVIFLYLVTSGEDRVWFKRPGPYLAGIITTVLSLPVFIWNLANGGVTFRHTMGQAHVGDAAFSLKEPLDFLASQAGLFTPLLFAGFVYGVYRCARKGFGANHGPSRLVFLASAFVFFFFLFAGFHGKVQANWAIAAYVTALPACVWAFQEAWERSLRQGRAMRRKVLAVVAVLAVYVGMVGTVIAYCPWLLEPLGARNILWGPPYNRVTAWAELGRKVSEVKKDMEAEGSEPVFIMSDTYQITSELAFYTEGQPVTYNIDTGTRRMNQYDLWGGLSGLEGRDAIYVKGGDSGLKAETAAAFESCGKTLFPIYYKGRLLKKFSIFRCRGFKGVRQRPDRKKRF